MIVFFFLSFHLEKDTGFNMYKCMFFGFAAKQIQLILLKLEWAALKSHQIYPDRQITFSMWEKQEVFYVLSELPL